MRTISGIRSEGAQRAAAVVVAAGLASAFSIGTASAETVPAHPSSITPLANAWLASTPDRWFPGDTVGVPGVAENGGTGTSFTAASRADIPGTLLTSSSAVTHDDTGSNRPRPEAYLQDGIYLAAPATVTLSWTMTGSATATGDNLSSVQMYVSIDCDYSDGGSYCPADGNGDDSPATGRRMDLSANDSRTDVDSIALPLTAGWHKLEALALADGRTSSTGSSTASASLDFAVSVPTGTQWASASGLLPVTGGTEIGDDTTPPPPPPPPAATPAQLLSELAASITQAEQDGMIRNAQPLLSKVEKAQREEAAGDEKGATKALTALVKHLRAQSGKHIPADLATAWSDDAAAVIAML